MSGRERIPLLSAGPALYFVLSFLLGLIIFALLNYDNFSLEGLNLFTLLWTWLALIIVHSLLNAKNFAKLRSTGKSKTILNSYLLISIYFLPYLIIALLYDNWFLFQKILSGKFSLADPALMKIDEFVFGIQPTIWLQKLLFPLAVDYFMIAYSLFIIYPFFYLIYLIQKNELQLFQKVLLAQNIAIVISLISFLVLPAVGPRVFIAREYLVPLQGINIGFLNSLTGYSSLFELQYHAWNFIERVKTDCMPSMHTGLCLLCLFYAVRYRNIFRWKKLMMFLWITGIISLIISTVYLRYHWVIDVFAGAVTAVFVYYLTEMIFNPWQKKTGHDKQDVPWIIESKRFIIFRNL